MRRHHFSIGHAISRWVYSGSSCVAKHENMISFGQAPGALSSSTPLPPPKWPKPQVQPDTNATCAYRLCNISRAGEKGADCDGDGQNRRAQKQDVQTAQS
jgi:hypothetical protein